MMMGQAPEQASIIAGGAVFQMASAGNYSHCGGNLRRIPRSCIAAPRKLREAHYVGFSLRNGLALGVWQDVDAGRRFTIGLANLISP